MLTDGWRVGIVGRLEGAPAGKFIWHSGFCKSVSLAKSLAKILKSMLLCLHVKVNATPEILLFWVALPIETWDC